LTDIQSGCFESNVLFFIFVDFDQPVLLISGLVSSRVDILTSSPARKTVQSQKHPSSV